VIWFAMHVGQPGQYSEALEELAIGISRARFDSGPVDRRTIQYRVRHLVE
jgi:hypothetical protein